MDWRIKYKCRHCGKLFDCGECGCKDVVRGVIKDIVMDSPYKYVVGIEPRKIIIHDCADGGIGIADIAGGSVVTPNGKDEA